MIKLKKINLYHLDYPLKNYVIASFGLMKSRPALILELTDTDDNKGLGEIWCNFPSDGASYKFNLFNPHESPWEGTRVAKKKNLKSIDFMRQKVKSKNLKYSFFRFDKETNLELIKKIFRPEKNYHSYRYGWEKELLILLV